MAFDKEVALRRLDEKLKQLQSTDLAPADLTAFLADIYRDQVEARATAEVVLPPEADLASPDMRVQGAPLWNRDLFPYDRAQALALFESFLARLEGLTGTAMAEAAAVVRGELDAKKLDPEKAFLAYLNDDAAFFEEWTTKTPDAPRTMNFLVQAALGPSLAAAAEGLAAQLDTSAVWAHGHCPVCGSLPLFSDLKDKEGYRHVTCSFCQTEYRVRRIACPYCGEDDAKKLSYFAANELVGFRVDCCQTCKSYIKTSDFRALDRHAVPVWDDLVSLVLDVRAQEEGFKRPTLSGWGF